MTKSPLWITFWCATAMLVGGCAFRGPLPGESTLRQATELELFSLEPNVRATSEDRFHNWPVLGHTTVSDASTRAQLVNGLFAAAASADGIGVGCFRPRHGIRVASSGKVTDFVICFECIQVKVYENERYTGTFLVADEPRQLFDDVLRQAGITLATPAPSPGTPGEGPG